MVQPSTETVTLASQLVESLVSSGLPRDFARLYSHHTRLRENQPGLMSWSSGGDKRPQTKMKQGL